MTVIPHAVAIERLTGIAPSACPWRVYDDPIIQSAMILRNHIEKGVVDIDEQLAIVLEAAQLITNLQSQIEVFDMREERKNREAEDNLNRANRQRP